MRKTRIFSATTRASLFLLLISLGTAAEAVEPSQMTGCLSPFGVLTKLSLGDKPAHRCWPKEREVSLRLDAADDSEAKGAFVTSELFTGNLGGISGADAKCQAAANAAGLQGRWRAWISDKTSSPASTFVRSEIPYVRVDGIRIAMNWDDLVNGSLLAPIEVDENGAYVPASMVMTDTRPDGTAMGTHPDGSERTCSNWTSESGVDPDAGYSSSTDAGWSLRGGIYFRCAGQNRLYCFQQ